MIKDDSSEVDLTIEEMVVILNIARRAGCDRDGDMLKFYVQEDQNIVKNFSIQKT